MNVLDEKYSLPKSSIIILGKGFRVSEKSEEFQLLVPQDKSMLKSSLENLVVNLDNWPSILQKIYDLNSTQVKSEFCVLITSSEFLFLSTAHTKDKHNRSSIIVVASVTPIIWDDKNLPLILGKSQALTKRLVRLYAPIFENAKSFIEDQLKKGIFIQNRFFELKDEPDEPELDWELILKEIKKWKGIKGISTLSLAEIGANILIGTDHEVGVCIGKGIGIDGRFDLIQNKILPIGSNLKLWEYCRNQEEDDEKIQKHEEGTVLEDQEKEEQKPQLSETQFDEHIKSIDNSLKSIASSVEIFVGFSIEAGRAIIEIIKGKKK